MDSDLKVVVIGGGTGLSILLSGLKQFTQSITAIVNVVDDGGSSGRLREDLGMLPPGDIRACLVALAATESELQKIFQYRFKSGELEGQNFGNIFLAAMNEVYGSFETAIEKTSDILAIQGRVMPMTLEDVTLTAVLTDGEIIEGESKIPLYVREHGKHIDHVHLNKKNPRVPPKAIEAIQDADLILIGPGSLYTSIMPNLLIEELTDALRKAKAPVHYLANVMTQPGETDGYSIYDHYVAMKKHANIDFLDRIYYNTQPVPQSVAEHYYNINKAMPLFMTGEEIDAFQKEGIVPFGGDFIDIKKNYIRHDAYKLCSIIFENHTRVYKT